jgi:PAS domain S-box-containing protein
MFERAPPAIGAPSLARQKLARVVVFLVIILVSLLAFLALYRQALVGSLVFGAGMALCLAVIAWLFRLSGVEIGRRARLEEQLRALNLELEDRIQERMAELKRARDLLDAVVENLPDMVLLKEASSDGFRYILVNAAGEELLGRDRREIVGKTERDLFPPDEAASIVQANADVLEARQARTFIDRKLTTATGSRTVETRMVPITNGSGSPHLLLAIIRDVTDAKSREEQLRQLQRMEAVGRLTGGVAHDFNNLLAIIHGNSELLLSRFNKQADARDMLDDVLSAATRGAELVRRLLAFARMQHLEPEAVDLNARLPDIVSLLQRALGENVSVRLELTEGLWPAIVDPTQVDDALVNLAINARDAMPGGGSLTIETRNVVLDEDYAAHHVEVTPGEYVMLAVSDTGTGMPPDIVERVFEPFFTTKPEGKGTGLGLSQVFGWVKQSRGHIKIYSEVGHGTTVKLYLPRAEALAAERSAEPQAATPTGDEKILVVEDNPNVRRTVIRQLHDLGYETVEADSGARALELVRDGLEFDLLLTDVIMPGGITGYDLAERLRAERPGLTVLFTSGYTELAAGDRSTLKDQLLSKPYRKQDLGRAVRSALDGRP